VGSEAWIGPGLTIQRDVPGKVILYTLPDNKERQR